VSSAIKQALMLGNVLVVHVPLCESHNKQWVAFTSHLRDSRRRAAAEKRDADWLLDSAVALALFPPGEPF